MAGMLPGVECARRRRFHNQSGGGSLDSLNSSSSSSHGSSTRRSSFCLYTTNNESHFSTISSVQQRSPQGQAYCDEKLGVAAREAKERLDGRLRAQWISEPKRNSGGRQEQQQPVRYINDMIAREAEMEVSGMKKKGTKSLSWGKLSWKSSEQDECSVCLEEMKEKETLIMQLPCAHTFHSKCLLPWLQDNSHCPCCRMNL